MNLIVSGWPGVGQTTLSLLLAKSLNYKIFQGGSTFRFLGKQLNYSNTGLDRIKADEILEKSWGPLFEKYIAWLALNRTHAVLETDITGFMIGKNSNCYSIFIKADYDIRTKRLLNDGRSNDINVLKERDNSQTKFFKEFFNVDFHDEDLINTKYNLVINSTHMSIKDELELIYSNLMKEKIIDSNHYNNLINNLEFEEKNFWKNKKEWYINYLTTQNLLADGEEIIKEIKIKFPKDCELLQVELRDIIKA